MPYQHPTPRLRRLPGPSSVPTGEEIPGMRSLRLRIGDSPYGPAPHEAVLVGFFGNAREGGALPSKQLVVALDVALDMATEAMDAILQPVEFPGGVIAPEFAMDPNNQIHMMARGFSGRPEQIRALRDMADATRELVADYTRARRTTLDAWLKVPLMSSEEEQEGCLAHLDTVRDLLAEADWPTFPLVNSAYSMATRRLIDVMHLLCSGRNPHPTYSAAEIVDFCARIWLDALGIDYHAILRSREAYAAWGRFLEQWWARATRRMSAFMRRGSVAVGHRNVGAPGGFSVSVTRRAEKGLRAMPKTDSQRMRKAIRALENEPRPGGTKTYRPPGEIMMYMARVGPWRALYTVDDVNRAIMIHDIMHGRELPGGRNG